MNFVNLKTEFNFIRKSPTMESDYAQQQRGRTNSVGLKEDVTNEIGFKRPNDSEWCDLVPYSLNSIIKPFLFLMLKEN